MSVTAIPGGAVHPLHVLFEHYMEVKRRSNASDWDEMVASEALERLRRLSWLEWEVRTRVFEVRNPWTEPNRVARLMIELPALAESWYYLAFRAMRLIKHTFPELKTFEIKSIAVTRNQLLEHPREIFNANLVIGERGPEIKGVRWEGQSDKFADVGLFASTEEFDTKLRGLLDSYPLRNAKEKFGPHS